MHMVKPAKTWMKTTPDGGTMNKTTLYDYFVSASRLV